MSRAIKHHRPLSEIIGCDISFRAVQTCQRNQAPTAVIQADACRLPLRNGQLDVVVMFDVLEHLECPIDALSEAARVLRVGGLLHLAVPCEGSLFTFQGMLRRLGWGAFERTVGHVQAFSLEGIRSLLSAIDVTIEDVKWSGHLVSQVAHCLYVLWLSLPGVEPSHSVEGYLEEDKPHGTRSFMWALKCFVAWLSCYESTALATFRGAVVHVTARK